MSDVSPADLSERPEKIGPYFILDELGAGGMGTVYLGRHAETQQIAAVKLLPPEMARESGFRLRFTREIEVLQTLNSPNVVRLYDSGEDGRMLYYAMEYVAGETLAQRLRRDRRISWRDAIDIVRQLCVALKAAHDAGVVHRDLKPSNILIDPNGDVKLTDFGIAQLFAAEKLTVTGGVVGTAEYMSPEQAQGQRATKRSDLYSLGAVLYVMLTGRPPFTGQSSVDIMHKHRFGQFDLPSRYVPEIPAAVDDIIQQLLEKDPDKRIPDAYVLLRRLDELIQRLSLKLSDQPTTASTPDVPLSETAAPKPAGGDATLVRDLVRAELSPSDAAQGLTRLFDNVWVLLGLLLVLVLGVWWIANRGQTPEQMFAAGEALMAEEPGSDWLKARDEYFQPLLDRDAAAWQDRVAPYLDDVAVYELEQRLTTSQRFGRRRSPPTEIERQLQTVRRLWDRGDLVEASSRLDAVINLWSRDAEAATAIRLARRWDEELQKQSAASPNPAPLLHEKLREAAALQAKDPMQAQAIRDAIVRLYTDDPRVQSLVEQARRPSSPE